MGTRYKALIRSGKAFDQKDFLKNTKRNPRNDSYRKVSAMKASERTIGRPKFMRYNTTFPRLLKLVLNMSEREQFRLLEYAKSMIDERTLPRNPCLIPVNCTLRDRTYAGLILDINQSGAYVDINETFLNGQEIYLSFFNPFSDRYMDLGGKVIWSSTYGIGVSFNDLSKAHYIW